MKRLWKVFKRDRFAVLVAVVLIAIVAVVLNEIIPDPAAEAAIAIPNKATIHELLEKYTADPNLFYEDCSKRTITLETAVLVLAKLHAQGRYVKGKDLDFGYDKFLVDYGNHLRLQRLRKLK